MKIDHFFEYVGDMGLFQVLLYVMVCTQAAISSMQNLGINFISAYQIHWCQVDRLSEFPHEIQKEISIPYSEDDPDSYDSCSYYNLDYTNLTDTDIWNWNRTSYDYSNVSTTSCDAWVYDQSEFISTINSKYNLVCDRSWMSSFVSTAYMFGMMMASLVTGLISDRVGRYKPWMITMFVYCGAVYGEAFAPNYTTFVIMRFLASMMSFIGYLNAYVVVAEFLSIRYRTILGIGITASGSIGIMLASGYAYAIRDHSLLLVLLASHVIPMCLIFPWIIPESPRWLMSKGQMKKAEKIMRHVATINRHTWPDHLDQPDKLDEKIKEKREDQPDTSSVASERKSDLNLSDICKSGILCGELALMYLNWFTTSLVYYGLSLNVAAFGDVFVNTFLSGLVEVPAYALCMLCMTKGNKRLSNSLCLLAGGVFCLSCVPIIITNPELEGALTALSTIGKGAIAFSFACIYVYSADLFPTPTRNSALGTSSIFARVGSMASPFMGPPMEDLWPPLPTLIFGSLSVFTGFMVLMLPETKGCALPDTIEEAVAIAKGRKVRKIVDSITVNETRVDESEKRPFDDVIMAYENKSFQQNEVDNMSNQEGEPVDVTRL